MELLVYIFIQNHDTMQFYSILFQGADFHVTWWFFLNVSWGLLDCAAHIITINDHNYAWKN